MKLDLTWTITAIIAVTSILSPIIVTFMNNRHNLKIRKLEIYSKIKQDVLLNFSKSIAENFNKNYVDFTLYTNLNLLYVYFNVDEPLLNKLLQNSYKNIYDYQKDVSNLMKKLSKQIKYKQ